VESKTHHKQGFYWAMPSQVYFKSQSGYASLFPCIDFQSDSANAFLKVLGVRSEPTVDEIAREMRKEGFDFQ
jgi:hypothetical protein